MIQIFIKTFLVWILLLSQLAWSDQNLSLKGPHTVINWISPVASSEGRVFYFGLKFKLDKDWHIYWKNPGDSGASPKFIETGSDFRITEVIWPTPERIKVEHLTNIGYSNEATLYFKAESLENVKSFNQKLNVKLNLEWLVCKIECIPGYGEISLETDIKIDPYAVDKINKLKPAPLVVEAHLVQQTDQKVVFQFKNIMSSNKKDPKFKIFPETSDLIAPAEPLLKIIGKDLEIEFTKSQNNMIQKVENLNFLFVQEDRAYQLQPTWINSSSSLLKDNPLLHKSNEASTNSLPVLLFFAFIGGFILNLMPCVFPLISIKAFGLINGRTQERRQDSLYYSLGVLVSFLILGSLFLVLKNLGETVGWGFQLQSPVFVYFMILVFWILSLNFLGAIDWGDRIASYFGRLKATSGFFSGVLAVLVATPCTGPFLGAALGATIFLSAFESILVFVFLGLGMALPYIVIALYPEIIQKWPRPGAWMEKLKQFFAFPLFLTVVWLFWVIDLQTDSTHRSQVLLTLVMVSFYFWTVTSFKKSISRTVLVLLLIKVFLTSYSLQLISSTENLAQSAHLSDRLQVLTDLNWEPFTEARLEQYLSEDRKVFIDFTAAWCITCQVNKKQVLDRKEVNQYFIDQNVVRMRADWTKPNPEISNHLKKLGRNSIPVYALYNGKDRQAVLLPQILTFQSIRNEINQLNNKEK